VSVISLQIMIFKVAEGSDIAAF